MGVVGEAVIVVGGIMQIEHGFGGLVDGEPVAQVYLPFRLIEFRVKAVCHGVEILLPVTEGQRGTIESEFGRGGQRGVVRLEFVEIVVGPDGYFCSFLIQTAET